MKQFKIIIIFSILFISVSNIFPQAQRKVLFEEGTNASCGPCAANNPTLEAFLSAHSSDLEAIMYHASWPGYDPMYSANPTQNTERIVNYYNMGGSGVPYCNADGVIQDIWPFSNANFTNALSTRMGVATPVSISVTDTRIAGDSIRSVVTLTLLSDLPTGNYKLRVMAIEGVITYATPPGTNGEMVFPYVFRRAYPNTTGVSITTTAGNYQYVYTYKKETGWVDSSIYTIAFLQNDNNKEVFNVAKGPGNINGIDPVGNGVPTAYLLSQNYPNPFNPTTNIDMALPKEGFVTLKLIDVLGREVQTLVNGNFRAGNYKIFVDGSALTSGLYFYKLSAGDFTATKKMILIK